MKKLKLLMELRPCMEGFAGIPQETRLLFSALHRDDGLDVHGLLNNSNLVLSPTARPSKKFSAATQHRQVNNQARFVISTRQQLKYRRWQKMQTMFWPAQRKFMAYSNIGIRLGIFDGAMFPDFLWDDVFAKSLDVSEYDRLTLASYRTLSAPWQGLHRLGSPGLFGLLPGRFPKIATHDYDLFLSQTPFPGRLSDRTQLVVRYHDAIPMFLPQHIPDMNWHRLTHYRSLRSNAKKAYFVCTTETVRGDLLKIFPKLESRSLVVHDVVSAGYFPQKPESGAIANILCARLDIATHQKRASRHRIPLPPWGCIRRGKLESKPFEPRFILMVSTIEPRKNHVRLIRAWERCRKGSWENLKLVIVGSLGWDNDSATRAMRGWQERGELFHLSRVPVGELRQLYSSAEFVVCPSLSEGFDLSGIEAMKCGAPVIASDIPVHREVYGQAARFFNPYSVAQAAQEMMKLLGITEAAERDSLVELGIERAARYDESQIAPKWSEALEVIARSRKG